MASQPANPTPTDAAAFVLCVVHLVPVFCAWCGGVIREGDDPESASHGICDDCFARLTSAPLIA